MTPLDWFMQGLCTGLLLALVAVRLGRRHRDH